VQLVKEQQMKSSKFYDGLKQTVQVWLPAIGALYFGLGNLWGFPEVENVVGSVTVLETVLGGVVVAMASRYKKSGAAYGGDLNIYEDEDAMKLELDVSKNPEVLSKQNEVLFKVNRGV
jgi:hypothetical protein